MIQLKQITILIKSIRRSAFLFKSYGKFWKLSSRGMFKCNAIILHLYYISQSSLRGRVEICNDDLCGIIVNNTNIIIELPHMHHLIKYLIYHLLYIEVEIIYPTFIMGCNSSNASWYIKRCRRWCKSHIVCQHCEIPNGIKSTMECDVWVLNIVRLEL